MRNILTALAGVSRLSLFETTRGGGVSSLRYLLEAIWLLLLLRSVSIVAPLLQFRLGCSPQMNAKFA